LKPAGWAILILSALLALSLGALAYVWISSSARVAAAIEDTEKAKAENIKLLASNAVLKANNEKQKLLDSKKDHVIAGLKQDHADLLATAGAAIEGETTLKAAYDAGAPIVESIAVPALTVWYTETEPKFDPVMAALGLLPLQLQKAVARVGELEGLNQQSAILHVVDGYRIAADESLLAIQSADLGDALGNLKAVRSEGAVKDIIMIGEGVVLLLALGYIGIHAAGFVP
jgi:hypothetical protein